jgi:hypothetical protein
MTANYTILVLNDLIPLIKKNYKVKTDKMNMAVAGLSMGAGQATYLGLTYLGKFGYVGAFSGGGGFDIMNANQVNDSIVLLFNGYGKIDELNIGQSFESQLRESKVNHITAEFSGGHEWQVWRKCLHQFAPLLFKPYTYEHPFLVKSINNDNKFSVYPNPFNGQIHLQFDNSAEFNNPGYELQDITGKIILSYTGEKDNAEKKISETLRSNSNGLYVLSLYTKENTYQVKIIK